MLFNVHIVFKRLSYLVQLTVRLPLRGGIINFCHRVPRQRRATVGLPSDLPYYGATLDGQRTLLD